MIAYDLDLPCSRTSKTEVSLRTQSTLVEQAQNTPPWLLIVDEAHNLEWEVLEEIRLLGPENRNGKTVADHPGGSPELDRKLDAPNLRQLKQRIDIAVQTCSRLRCVTPSSIFFRARTCGRDRTVDLFRKSCWRSFICAPKVSRRD